MQIISNFSGFLPPALEEGSPKHPPRLLPALQFRSSLAPFASRPELWSRASLGPYQRAGPRAEPLRVMAIQIVLLLFGLVGTGSAGKSVSLGSTVYIRACDHGKVMVPPPGTRLPANFTMQWILRAPRGKQIRLLLRELELRMVGRGGCQDALALKNGYPPFEESSQVICGAWDNTEVLGEYRMTLRMHVGTGSVIPREVGMHLEYSCADRKQENATAPCHRMFPCSASVKDYLRWTQCQPLSAKCDGIEQCHNGEDEQNCSGKSLFDPESSGLGSECPHKGLFECERQSCIPKQWVCDGKRDCDNGADEKKAMCRQLRTTAATALPRTVPTKSPKRSRRRCPRRKFLCPEEGVCIRKRYVCDGLKDCSRGEDEANCEARTTAPASTVKPTTSAPKDPCSPKKFYCRSEGVCISKKFVCDKFEDCKEGEDEKNCDKPKKCGHKKFPPKGYWYWNLLVRSRGHKLCAAVLIDDRVALTAAHCARRCLHEGSNCEVVLSSRLRKVIPALLSIFHVPC